MPTYTEAMNTVTNLTADLEGAVAEVEYRLEELDEATGDVAYYTSTLEGLSDGFGDADRRRLHTANVRLSELEEIDAKRELELAMSLVAPAVTRLEVACAAMRHATLAG